MRRSTFATRARKAKRFRAVVKVNTLKLALGVLVQRADPDVSHPLSCLFAAVLLSSPTKCLVRVWTILGNVKKIRNEPFGCYPVDSVHFSISLSLSLLLDSADRHESVLHKVSDCEYENNTTLANY